MPLGRWARDFFVAMNFQTMITLMATSSANMLIFAGWMGFTLLCAWASYAGKWCKAKPQSMVFKPPPVGKLVLLVGGLLVLAFLPDIYVAGQKPGANWELTASLEVLTGSVGALLLWVAGIRRELAVDLERRRYRLTNGWLFWNHRESGDWNDFRGIFIQVVNGRHRELYFVGLSKPGKQSQVPFLGQFEDWNEALAFASKMSTAMGMSIVAAPAREPLKILSR